MRVKINQEECSGDGICSEICPEVFELRADGVSYVIADEPDEYLSDRIDEAVNECPACAIVVEE